MNDTPDTSTTTSLPFSRPAVTSFPVQPVDPASPIPLYHQVEVDLRALIASGTIAPDDLLPPETELCKMYGVGRQTVRMALSRLVADRLIARQAGRGTFVLPHPDRTNFYLDRSFTRQMAELGIATHSSVLHSSTGTINHNSPRVLRDRAGAPYLHLARLRFGDRQPVGLQYTTVITTRCPGIEGHDFSQVSLYDVLSRDYRLAVVEITHTVTAIAADQTQADLLQVNPGSPLLQVNTTAYLADREVIECSISFYRTDKYEYTTTHAYSG